MYRPWFASPLGPGSNSYAVLMCEETWNSALQPFTIVFVALNCGGICRTRCAVRAGDRSSFGFTRDQERESCSPWRLLSLLKCFYSGACFVLTNARWFWGLVLRCGAGVGAPRWPDSNLVRGDYPRAVAWPQSLKTNFRSNCNCLLVTQEA